MNGNRFNMEKKYLTLEDLYDLEEYDVVEDQEISKYSNWIYDKSTYSPAIDIEIVKSVEKGVYKINNDFKLIKQEISSDGLYKFKNSESKLILEETSKFWETADRFKKFNLIHKRGILLEGPPGTGKSSIITLIINELVEKYNGVVFLINNIADFTKTYDFLKPVFKKIEPNRFIITIIEDIDKICTDAIEPEVLDFFDGKQSIENHLIICTSNDTSEIPDALLRVSRIDKKFYIGTACEDIRREYFSNKGVSGEDLELLVKNSEDLTISELKELFIGTYVMGNSFDEVLNQILNPKEKQNYSIRKSNTEIQID